MEEMNAASQQSGESETQPAVIVATAEELEETRLAELERRINELESAMSDLRSVKAQAAGRKTSASMMAKGTEAVDLDAALQSLSVEQRIAVKSGLMRAGVL